MKQRTGAHRSLRGSALISVLLVVLVLTVVGLGVAYFMQVEDKLSGNDRTMKTSFYAAEAGLKAGEAWINAGFQQAGNYLYLGQLVNTSNTEYLPPGGGQKAYLLVISNVTTPSAAPSFLNLPVSSTDPSQGTFTLYVRHDINSDPATTVNLVSVGEGAGGRYQRVLEEQLTIPNLTTSAQPTQGGGTPGGAGSVSAGS